MVPRKRIDLRPNGGLLDLQKANHAEICTTIKWRKLLGCGVHGAAPACSLIEASGCFYLFVQRTSFMALAFNAQRTGIETLGRSSVHALSLSLFLYANWKMQLYRRLFLLLMFLCFYSTILQLQTKTKRLHTCAKYRTALRAMPIRSRTNGWKNTTLLPLFCQLTHSVPSAKRC